MRARIRTRRRSRQGSGKPSVRPHPHRRRAAGQFAVVFDERLGLRLVDLEALADDLLPDRRDAGSGAADRRTARSAAADPAGAVSTLNTRPQSSQMRRPVRRLNSTPRSRFSRTTASSGCPRSASILASASAWARLRGKPSRMKPLAASGCARRSRIMPSTMASSTSLPASMAALARSTEFGPRRPPRAAGRRWIFAARRRS